MSKLILEGGTDVAEVALFCVDDIPEVLSDDESVTEMQNRKTLIRLPTGADGGYLLHLYVSEAIPNETLKYCVQEDKLTGEFNTKSGNVGFGGLESTYSKFEPNKNIRENGKIEKGSYMFSAFHTEYPDELIEEAVHSEIGPEGIRKLDISGKIILAGVLSFLVLLFFAFKSSYAFFVGAFAVIPLAVFAFKKYTGTENFKRIEQQKYQVEKNFPSIVIHLEKNA
tara:strand:- start:429 stop:1103 length:675 start_codon:yes stop_codon:yes gene_type:complete